jgi:hypothetical protein
VGSESSCQHNIHTHTGLPGRWGQAQRAWRGLSAAGVRKVSGGNADLRFTEPLSWSHVELIL